MHTSVTAVSTDSPVSAMFILVFSDMHIIVKVVATDSAVTLMGTLLPLLSQRCARFRWRRAVLLFAVKAQCALVSERCGIPPVYRQTTKFTVQYRTTKFAVSGKVFKLPRSHSY